VPIYWGAENITDYIPKETFIDRRDFKNDLELLLFIKSINETSYAQYIANIELFLKSENYKKFLPENFFINIKNALKL
jgi:hypothetical protein